MNHWALVPEFVALLVIGVIMMFYYDKKQIKTPRRKLFWFCLGISATSIILNVICVYLIEYSQHIPLMLNVVMNTLYFWISMAMCTVMAYYLFQRILEYVYDKRCMAKAKIGLSAVMILYTFLAIWNLRSEVFFYFDEFGHYQHGRYNRIGYGGLLVEAIMLGICYIRNRKSVSKETNRVLKTAVPIALFIAVLQVSVLRFLYLNGTIIAVVNLIIFISFQNRPIETDSLTGLGNRKYFFDELALRTDGHQKYQIISVSLNNFGAVTRKHGYQKGDAILHEIAKYLSEFHIEGRAYRISNVTFAIILPWKGEYEQELFIEKITDRFNNPWKIGSESYDVEYYGASLTYQFQDWTAEQVLIYIEYALTQAKKDGLKMVCFDTCIEQRFQRREYVLETLQRAIKNQCFQVYYQPVYHCKEQCFASAEALVRLKDYINENISPAEFIPLAEETKMIDEISWIVIEKVCALMGGDGVPGLKQVSINLSMQQFLRKDLVERIDLLMKRYSTPADAIRFEITERVLLDDASYINEIMNQMREKGLQFYLDDFGTGYANFSQILDLPFEVVKLDKSLLAKHPEKPKAQSLPDVLVSFFHDLGHIVVAEGVETKEQLEWMQRIGVDRIQGFYFARPMTEDDLRAIFAEQEKERIAKSRMEVDKLKKVAVRYAGNSEKLRKLANAFAEAANVEANDITVPLTEKVEVLFVGNDDNTEDAEIAENFIYVFRDMIKKIIKF